MPVPPLLLASATEQSRQVSSGALDAASLLRQQLAAIAATDPHLNAFVEVIAPDPGEANSAWPSPLAGACFAVKDNIDVRGLPSHAGLRALHAQPAPRDAGVVARLKAAGLQCVGKLNMHAAALGATNHNIDFGNARNPRRLTHTPGGSSGGAGAAVAAGLCAIALGTDTMGSVRIPASYCGVVGFKPSFEAIGADGVVPLCRLLDHVGILARSVEDVVHAFAATGDVAGKATRGGSGVPVRLAIPSSLGPLDLEPVVRNAFEAALDRLRETGFSLHPLDLAEYPFSRARRAGLLLCEAELLNTLAQPLAQWRDEIPRHLLAMLEYAEAVDAASLARALAVVVEAGRWVHHALLPFDALVMPTAAQTAFAMDAPVPPNQADFTAMANMSGGPAISVPMPVPANALPAGLQLTARRGEDTSLLVAASLVQAALH